MLCAKLGHWPFTNPPDRATQAQVQLLTQVYLDLQPKMDDTSSLAPHGKLDRHTMAQWRERFKRAKEDDDGGHN